MLGRTPTWRVMCGLVTH